MTTSSVRIPGYVAATWDIDPTHSDISFSVRHMMVGKVRGRFTNFSGEIVTGEDISDSSVNATIAVDSVDTANEQRDNHIRSADFFDADNYPQWSFHSTGARTDGDEIVLDGDLTIKGVTRPVSLVLEVDGFGPDTNGGYRAGFTASTTIDRNDYGVNIKMPMDGGGVVVGDKVQITMDIEAVRRQA